METLDNELSSNLITENSRKYLKETSSWSLFLSILGFIGVGLMVIGALISLVTFSQLDVPSGAMPFPPILISLIYFILAGIYFLPIYYLFKFSRSAAKAASSSDSLTFEECFMFMKSHYKTVGIMTIVVISLYIIAIIGFLGFGLNNF